MAHLLRVLVAAMLALSASPVSATEPHHPTPARWQLFTPDQIQWRDGPPSLLPGAQVAILEGDPTKPGLFTMRLKLPDGYRVMPHWHPMTERLTIIQGVVNLGTGDRFDERATQPLAAGTYSAMPPRMHHFAWMKGETILQLSSIGPWQVVYVDPADDPRHHAR
jgi:uncharacterized protein DUF4437